MRALDIGSAGGNNYPWEWTGFDVREGTPALADYEGDATFYITRHPDGSSLLKPNKEFWKDFPAGKKFDVVREEPTKVTTLDSLNLQADFIKIDVQGAEGMVIRGGINTIKNASCVEVETNFAPRYIGQSYFSEIDVTMRELGFALMDFKRRYYKKGNPMVGGPRGQLTHGDALYMKEVVPEEILQYYGYNASRKKLFPGQGRLAHSLKRIGERLTPNSLGGTAGDASLGNRDFLL